MVGGDKVMMYDLRNGHFEGQLYLSRTVKPVAKDTLDGTFCIMLLAFSMPAPNVVTPWRITWSGDAALGFWCQHSPEMLPGVAINVDLSYLTVHDGAGRGKGAEIHARAMHIELASADASEYTTTGSLAEPVSA